MSPIQLTLLIFAVMLVLMALRTPIAIAMFAAGTVGYVTKAGWLPLANFLNTQAFARFASEASFSCSMMVNTLPDSWRQVSHPRPSRQFSNPPAGIPSRCNR